MRGLASGPAVGRRPEVGPEAQNQALAKIGSADSGTCPGIAVERPSDNLPRAMTIQVTGKNLDVGEALRNYVQERVVHTVEKFMGREPSGHIRIEKEHGEFRTNCTMHLWQGMSLEAHGIAADAYQSVDRACERLEKRVRRYTRRLKKHGGETPRKQTPATDYVIQASPEGQEEHDDDNPVIIAEAESPLHEMAVSDAVMQMDLSDRP